MNISKFTQKSLEAVQNCEKLAYEHGNQQIEQEHLLYSLLTIDDSLILKLVTKMGISGEMFKDEALQNVEKLPKVSGSSQVYVSNDLNKVLVSAEDEAKAMGDEYVSVEPLFLAMLRHPSPSVVHAAAAGPDDKGDVPSVRHYQRDVFAGPFHRERQPAGGQRQPGGYL